MRLKATLSYRVPSRYTTRHVGATVVADRRGKYTKVNGLAYRLVSRLPFTYVENIMTKNENCIDFCTDILCLLSYIKSRFTKTFCKAAMEWTWANYGEYCLHNWYTSISILISSFLRLTLSLLSCQPSFHLIYVIKTQLISWYTC